MCNTQLQRETRALLARRIARESPQDSTRFREHILGRISGKLSPIESGDSPIDLFRPRGFNFRYRHVQGLQERLRELRPLFGAQLSSLFFQLLQ